MEHAVHGGGGSRLEGRTEDLSEKVCIQIGWSLPTHIDWAEQHIHTWKLAVFPTLYGAVESYGLRWLPVVRGVAAEQTLARRHAPSRGACVLRWGTLPRG